MILGSCLMRAGVLFVASTFQTPTVKSNGVAKENGTAEHDHLNGDEAAKSEPEIPKKLVAAKYLTGDAFVPLANKGTLYKISVDKKKPIRIYVDGIFDLFHEGHFRLLLQAAYFFKGHNKIELIVGVNGDKDTHAKKGKTVRTQKERVEMIRLIPFVKTVIDGAPWVIDEDFIKKNKIDFIAHDEELYPSGDVADIYAYPKKEGKFIPTMRTRGVSTSEILARILKDNSSYLLRQSQRGNLKMCGVADFTKDYVRQEEIKARAHELLDELFEKINDPSEVLLDVTSGEDSLRRVRTLTVEAH
ncbi:choline-phosphate cytidylyltransferase [Enteropsectra breve]|nr:choline-phosphate cytidylyltransferase [Enteropsectra breve]